MVAYHISPVTHKPERCKARIACRYKAQGVKHFDTKAKAETYLEETIAKANEENTAYKIAYAKAARSPKMAKNLINEKIEDKDLQAIIDSTAHKKRLFGSKVLKPEEAEKLGVHDAWAYPIKHVRANSARIQELETNYANVSAFAAQSDEATKLSTYYAMRDSLDSDYEALKKDIANDPVNIESDTVFMHRGTDGAFFVTSYAKVDEEQMLKDGINPNNYYKSTKSTDKAKLREYMDDNGIDTKDAFKDNVIYYANKKSYNDIVKSKNAPTYESRFSNPDTLSKMTISEKRDAFFTTGLLKHEATKAIDAAEGEAREQGLAMHGDAGWAFNHTDLKFTARKQADFDEKAAEKAVGHENMQKFQRTSAHISVGKLKADPTIPAYKYLKPSKRMEFKLIDPSNGRNEALYEKPKTAYVEPLSTAVKAGRKKA